MKQLDSKFSPKQIDMLTKDLELDLIAFYRVVKDQVLEVIHTAKSEDDMRNKINDLFK